MSTRCQIEFKCGDVRRTVYRHWDGYPAAVIPDLLAFLQWSTRSGDIEYEAANFLFWSKQGLDDPQLGFGICANDELHGDVEYYYIVEHVRGGAVVRAFRVEGGHVDALLSSVALPQPLSFSSASRPAMELPRVRLNGVWYFRDDRLREFRRCDNPHERITFDELRGAA